MASAAAAPVAHYILPAPRISYLRIGGPLWLLAWFAGLYGSVAALGTGHTGYGLLDAFLFLWLTVWLISGALVFGLVLWTFVGREHITIGPESLTIQRRVVLPGPARHYPLREIENLRFREMPTDFFRANSRWSLLGVGKGKIRFDHGGESYSCGLGLSDGEARQIIADLSAHL